MLNAPVDLRIVRVGRIVRNRDLLTPVLLQLGGTGHTKGARHPNLVCPVWNITW